jgi:hypothetical protein
MADRIQARAIRRCGELLREIPKANGARTDIEPSGDTPTRLTRASAATDAGLSRDQRVTALRVANVPAPEFEEAVESEAPPTVTALAECGKGASRATHKILRAHRSQLSKSHRRNSPRGISYLIQVTANSAVISIGVRVTFRLSAVSTV